MQPSRASRCLLAAPVLLAFCACGAGERASSAVVRDSAGIEIIENAAPLWREGMEWRLSDHPVLEIGVLEGASEYQFERIAGAARLSDGRIVVADGGANELRFYDSSGAYVLTAGRKGEGPGEFQNLGSLYLLTADSLLTYDWRLRRVSVFGADGRLARSMVLHGPGDGFPNLQGRFSNGSLLASLGRSFRPGDKGGVSRDSALYLLFAPNGGAVDTLGWFPGPEYYVKATESSVAVRSLAFGRTPATLVRGDELYFGPADRFEVGLYSAAGKLTRLIRRQHSNLDVTPEDIERYKQEQLEQATDPNWRRFQQEMLADMPFPKTMPAYSRMVVDEPGDLWVAEYRRPGDDQPRWNVFDPDGRMLGTVRTPPDFVIFQIGADFLLGSWRDELDVQHLRMYRLIKPGRRG